jgi:hypothetical protein
MFDWKKQTITLHPSGEVKRVREREAEREKQREISEERESGS